jgi:hypothetical protein
VDWRVELSNWQPDVIIAPTDKPENGLTCAALAAIAGISRFDHRRPFPFTSLLSSDS